MDYNDHPLAMGNKYAEGEIPLFALVEEIAQMLDKRRPVTWSKDGANNDLRRDISAALNIVGLEAESWRAPNLLREFSALATQGVIRPRHPHLGVPVISPNDISLECYVSETEASAARVALLGTTGNTETFDQLK